METPLKKRRRRVGEDKFVPEIPFSTNWNIGANITEDELENFLVDLHGKYKAWDIELSVTYPAKNYETRKEYLANCTPAEKLQKEVNEIQLSLWHRLIGIRSKKYSSKDIANTVMFLLLLKTNPFKCPKEKEFLKF